MTLNNYANIIGSLGFGRAFLNSFLIAVPATILPISLGALAAYAFAFLRFWGRKTIFLIIVALMVMPVQAGFVQPRLGQGQGGDLVRVGVIA